MLRLPTGLLASPRLAYFSADRLPERCCLPPACARRACPGGHRQAHATPVRSVCCSAHELAEGGILSQGVRKFIKTRMQQLAFSAPIPLVGREIHFVETLAALSARIAKQARALCFMSPCAARPQ